MRSTPGPKIQRCTAGDSGSEFAVARHQLIDYVYNSVSGDCHASILGWIVATVPVSNQAEYAL